MTIGRADDENSSREGWSRDQDDEISIDGYNAFIIISTNDGTSGVEVQNSIGAISFSTNSIGDGYFAKKLGIGTDSPYCELDVVGKIQTELLQITSDPIDGYVATSDLTGNVYWKESPGSPQNHRNLDQLVHNIAETSFETYTYNGNKIVSITIWTDNLMTTKIREEIYNYNNENISMVTINQYNDSGMIVETVIENYSYLNNKVSSITRAFV